MSSWWIQKVWDQMSGTTQKHKNNLIEKTSFGDQWLSSKFSKSPPPPRCFSPTFISIHIPSFSPFSYISLFQSHLSFSSSSVLSIPPPLSISISTCISLTFSLFHFSPKEYIRDADKCNGPLAESPLQLRLGRRFSNCINPLGLFSVAFSIVQTEDGWITEYHSLGLAMFEWQLWASRLFFDKRQEKTSS